MITFIKKVILFLLPLILIFIIPITVLFLSREYLSIDQVIQIQNEHKEALFGFIYNDLSFIPYKQTLVSDKNPEIIALGTSRVMQIRKEFFKDQDKFINAGGGVKNIYDIEKFIQNLSSTSTVKVILLGLDQDMFTNKDNKVSDISIEDGYFNIWKKLLFINIRKIYTDYLHHKYSLRLLFDKRKENSMGIIAMVEGDGFRSDGSYRYGHVINELDMVSPAQKEIQDTLNSMDIGRYSSFITDGNEDKNIEALKSILDLAKSRNIQIVGFLPPFPSALYDYMKNNDKFSNTINILPGSIERVFKEFGFDFIDFSNTKNIDAPDTEFVDSIHGSDKMYARMLIYMTKNTSSLKKYIDVKTLRNIIDSNKGNILTI